MLCASCASKFFSPGIGSCKKCKSATPSRGFRYCGSCSDSHEVCASCGKDLKNDPTAVRPGGRRGKTR